ncbi:hypothetical protein ACFLZJ_01355, partial [Nanoarchaeota archaeon]
MPCKNLEKNLIKDFNPSNYQTVEQKYIGRPVSFVGDKVKTFGKGSYKYFIRPVSWGVKELGKGLFKGAYGGIMGSLRLPTTIRKTINDQAYLYKAIEDNTNVLECIGAIFGTIWSVGMGGAKVAIPLIEEGNYVPLAAFVATNIASGIHEIGRLKRSKAE